MDVYEWRIFLQNSVIQALQSVLASKRPLFKRYISEEIMFSLFRKKRVFDSKRSAEKLADSLLSLNNLYVTNTKFLEVTSKGTRTFGVSFHKNIPYMQFNYSVAKEIWIESTENGSRAHIKTRPIVFIWALPLIMLSMLPLALQAYGIEGVFIFLAPMVLLDVLFLGKSTTENAHLNELIDSRLRKI